MALLSSQIHNALLNTGQNAIGAVRTRNKDTKMLPGPMEELEGVYPSEVLVNELSSTSATARRNRQTFRDEMAAWRWLMTLRFDQEVALDDFRDSLEEDPIFIERDETFSTPQCYMRLKSVNYAHPVHQSSSTGTQATFTFEADLSPV